ncbi:hypothetical protein KL918_003484 [Ogataea parapolymorpha]|uniref:B box-type domain-containing protein n=1 Tax=Ogataea parapolymorpha (strain ATCC 26012 / BCRC 20466 / JCM 22074 / NRRL Y-7560 / DL-1) TaxID=871575 RepID=W1Q990_OGAPD|nr:type-III integral membrane protein of unknown function [Ogataea parapolymorpha DL-1]ESW95925.1 type-III integral membrane protein of unknown function [Ogataea parapolymorpha DL-1]KAG7866587.1 hypothetical protein KL918_003484 [Ogataea parapolymorpha]KAG7871122.1 hypothetical protein KL916_004310 [Ogataea parapolymorpha]
MELKRTLAELLDEDQIVDDVEESGVQEEPQEEDDTVNPDFCIDCKHTATEIQCLDCNEPFCRVCFQFVHRGGTRKQHKFKELVPLKPEPIAETEATDNIPEEALDEEKKDEQIEKTILAGIRRNARFIPLRLSYEERQLLRLLEATLSVSEYTDRVDILSYRSRTKRIVEQLREICSILAGLVVSSNMKVGQKLIQDKTFSDNQEWYKTVFEIGRRYKIMNPERMRDTFGKLCYVVMDSMLPEVREHMEFDLYAPIKTVLGLIESKNDKSAIKMFDDPLIISATAEIRPEKKTRSVINRQIKHKESAIERLSSRYSSPDGLTKEEVRQILYSIGDFNAYTNKNRLPVLRMIKRLDDFFKSSGTTKYSLGIRYGQGGARLTHNHEKQYLYVKQALELWSHVMRDMIELWAAADDDLFNGQQYQLTNTGQGLNRVKACPVLYKKMYNLLYEVQRLFDYWVGTPVIHLGDDAVPNALFFLDKYIQIPSILIPIDRCIQEIDVLAQDPHLEQYFCSQFETVEDLKKTILCDYFKHGFDGSGADNFYFAGSCVDAVSTSSCEFCNNIWKKDYYKVFLLTGFTNFNGEGY